MKKSTKQKDRTQKNNQKRQAKGLRRQQRKLKTEARLKEIQSDGQDGVVPSGAAQRRAALLARFRQSQWKQRVKAGKAASARVEKRFNRGG